LENGEDGAAHFDVVLNLLPVGAAVHEDLLNTGIGKEFEGVLDQRGIREG
jgi:hypothetical protein